MRVSKSNLHLCKTEQSELDYILAAETDKENSQFIIPWSREQHLQAIANPDIAHLSINNGTKIGYVILAGLLDSNYTIEFRRIVILGQAFYELSAEGWRRLLEPKADTRVLVAA